MPLGGQGFSHLTVVLLMKKKLLPSKVHETDQSKPAPIGSRLALIALKEELGPDVLTKFEARWEEKYDLEDDPLYNTWKKLKLKGNRVPLTDITPQSNLGDSTPTSNLDSILQVPVRVDKNLVKRTIKGTACLPKHLSGPEVVKFLEEQRSKKENEEKEKEEHKQRRTKESKRSGRKRKGGT